MGNDNYLISDLPDEIPSGYIAKLKTLLKTLHDQLRRTDAVLIKHENEIKKLLRERDDLKHNISSLFKTIRSEIERKEKLLTKLRNEHDSMRFHCRENSRFQRYRCVSPFERYRRSQSRCRNLKNISYNQKVSKNNISWSSPKSVISNRKIRSRLDVEIEREKDSLVPKNNKSVSKDHFINFGNEEEFRNSDQTVMKSNRKTQISHSHDSLEIIIDGKIRSYEFECPKIVTPIRNTPDYLKEKLQFLENKPCAVSSTLNEFKIVGNLSPNLNSDDIEFIGNSKSESPKVDNIHLISPFKNCILMDINFDRRGNIYHENCAVSTSIDVEHKKFTRKKTIRVKKIGTFSSFTD